MNILKCEAIEIASRSATIMNSSSPSTQRTPSCFGTSNRFHFGRFALRFDGRSSATAPARTTQRCLPSEAQEWAAVPIRAHRRLACRIS